MPDATNRTSRSTSKIFDSPSPQAAAIDGETYRKMHQLIDELPDECRTLIRATYFRRLDADRSRPAIGNRQGLGKPASRQGPRRDWPDRCEWRA